MPPLNIYRIRVARRLMNHYDLHSDVACWLVKEWFKTVKHCHGQMRSVNFAAHMVVVLWLAEQYESAPALVR